MAAEWLTVRTGDGRDLEVLRDGPPDAMALVFHSGTPSGAVEFPALSEAVAELGGSWSPGRDRAAAPRRRTPDAPSPTSPPTPPPSSTTSARTASSPSGGRAVARTPSPARR